MWDFRETGRGQRERLLCSMAQKDPHWPSAEAPGEEEKTWREKLTLEWRSIIGPMFAFEDNLSFLRLIKVIGSTLVHEVFKKLHSAT